MLIQFPDFDNYVNDLITKGLNDREKDIVLSVASYQKAKGGITEGQQSLLRSIADRYTDEKVQQNNNWYASFTDEMKENFRICCEYYGPTGYFQSSVARHRKDPDYVPHETEYKKICENKYAKRLLENREKAPLFPVGSLVIVNSKYRGNSYHSVIVPKNTTSFNGAYNLHGLTMMIVDNSVFVEYNLNRYVRVMLFNSPETVFLIREDNLKKHKPAATVAK